MSDQPWVKFFSSDWLAGTSGLSAAERGVYITLCALIYEHEGPIQRDDRRLARRCGCPKASFVRTLQALVDEEKITEIDGFLTNAKCEKELSDRAKRSEKARSVALQRWSAPEQKRQQKQGPSDASAMLQQCEPEPELEELRSSPPIIPPKRKTQIPEDREPNARNFAAAEKRGLSQSQAVAEFDRFKNHHLAKGSVFKDWDRAWLTWLDSPYRKPPSPTKRGSKDERTARILARSQAQDDSGQRPPSNGGVVGDSGDHVSGDLLPAGRERSGFRGNGGALESHACGFAGGGNRGSDGEASAHERPQPPDPWGDFGNGDVVSLPLTPRAVAGGG